MAKQNNEDVDEIVAYKGFDADFRCRGYQFEVGKTYTHDGPIALCESGFHACEFPLDVFIYYPPSESRYAMVRASGSVDRGDGSDTKFATASLEIVAEVGIPDIVSRAVKWILARVDSAKKKSNTGYQSAATNTGNCSAATNTGDQSAAEVSGAAAVAIATGALSKARAGVNGAIVLVNRDNDGNIRHIRAAKVGDGIKADTWYSLGDDGEFAEAK